MYFINKIRKALYEANGEQVFSSLTKKLEMTIGRYFEIYKDKKELPKGVFELFIEICNTPELYNKIGMSNFIDTIYSSIFKENQKLKMLEIVFNNFNNYPPYTKHNFLYALFRMLKTMYEPYATNLTMIDFYAHLYLSVNTGGKEFLKSDLFYDDWQLVEKRIKELDCGN